MIFFIRSLIMQQAFIVKQVICPMQKLILFKPVKPAIYLSELLYRCNSKVSSTFNFCEVYLLVYRDALYLFRLCQNKII